LGLSIGALGCGLTPPDNLRLNVASGAITFPTADSCADSTQLREAQELALTLPEAAGGTIAMRYAVMCGTEIEGRAVRQGLYLGWSEDGSLAARGAFAEDRPHGQWELFHPNGELRARLVLNMGAMVNLGEFFDAAGKPDPEKSFDAAKLLGSVKAYEELLARFPDATFRGEAMQKLAATELAQSGAYISKKKASNVRDLIAFYHLDKTPRGKHCTMGDWNANEPERCKIFEKKCRTAWGSHRQFTSCWVNDDFFESVRGLAARRADCKSRDTECALATDAVSPFVNGAKEGLWIDFPVGGRTGPCEWGRYEDGIRTGLWVKWETCNLSATEHGYSDHTALWVGVGEDKTLPYQWWNEVLMQEAMVSLATPDEAFEYVDGQAKPVDTKKVLVAMRAIKHRQQKARVKKRIDACLKKPWLLYGMTKGRGRKAVFNSIALEDLDKTWRADRVEVKNLVGECAAGDREPTEKEMAVAYFSELCKGGNERACAEPRWHGFKKRPNGTLSGDPVERAAFAKELLALCQGDAALSQAACLRLREHVEDLHYEALKPIIGGIDAAEERCGDNMSPACENRLEALWQRREAVVDGFSQRVGDTACTQGALTVCVELGHEAHAAGQHKKADVYFQRGCDRGADGLCGYDSRQLAAAEAKAAKEKAAEDARYESRCITSPDGSFECKRVLKGSRAPTVSPACRTCRAAWRKECRVRGTLADFCGKIVEANCASYCR